MRSNAKITFPSPLASLSVSENRQLVCVGGMEVLALCTLDLAAHSLSMPMDIPTSYMRITDVAFNRANQNLLACGTTRGGVDIFDYAVATRIEALPSCGRPHSSAVNRVTWNPSDANTLVSASSDGTLLVLDVRAREPVQVTLTPKSREVRDVVFSPHELYSMAACFSNGTVKLFDYRHPRHCLLDVLAHDGIAMSLAYHPERRGVLASGGSSAREGAFNLKLLAPERDAKMLGLIRTPSGVTNLGWRPGHNAQLAAATDFNVLLWDVEDWPNVPLSSIEAAQVTRFAWVDADNLLLCGKDGVLQLRSLASEPRPMERTRGLKLSFRPSGEAAVATDAIPKGLVSALLTGGVPPVHRRGKARAVFVRPPAVPRIFAYKLGPDLPSALKANADAARNVPELRGFWLGLDVLLSAPAGVKRREEEKARTARDVVDSAWWTSAQLRLLRALQNVDPLEGFHARPRRGAMRQAMHELDSGLAGANRPAEFVPVDPAVQAGALASSQLFGLVTAAVLEMADRGELQTCVVACLVLRSTHAAVVSPAKLLSWVDAYVELLRRFSMFAEAKDVLLAYGGAPRADRDMDIVSSAHAATCALCRLAVTGRYAACGGCGHGGHVAHVQDWFAHEKFCPVLGCGHRCTE